MTRGRVAATALTLAIVLACALAATRCGHSSAAPAVVVVDTVFVDTLSHPAKSKAKGHKAGGRHKAASDSTHTRTRHTPRSRSYLDERVTP